MNTGWRQISFTSFSPCNRLPYSYVLNVFVMTVAGLKFKWRSYGFLHHVV